MGELCWVVVSLRWGWGAGAGAEQLHVLCDVSRIWVTDTKLHPSHPSSGAPGAGAGAWWQREVGAAGTSEARE